MRSAIYDEHKSPANREHVQTKHNVNRRKTIIDRDIKQFESIREQIKKLIDLGRAPANASVPQSLINQRIWDLGVDDPIWSDPALYAGGDDVPRWMYDTTFKAGIRAVLQLDRCSEESERLESEMEGFISWVADRFNLLNQAWYESAGTLHTDYLSYVLSDS